MGRCCREEGTRYERVIIDDAAAGPTGVRDLRKGGTPPDLATIKDFLRFHAAISRGRIDGRRTTADSLNAFAEDISCLLHDRPVGSNSHNDPRLCGQPSR